MREGIDNSIVGLDGVKIRDVNRNHENRVSSSY
jgi:hypothetical protein